MTVQLKLKVCFLLKAHLTCLQKTCLWVVEAPGLRSSWDTELTVLCPQRCCFDLRVVLRSRCAIPAMSS